MNRWVRLIGSVIAMAMIANLQYAWALFVKPIMGATGWKLSDVQWGFTIFIALETWAQPFMGRYMDKRRPEGKACHAAVLFFSPSKNGQNSALFLCISLSLRMGLVENVGDVSVESISISRMLSLNAKNVT